MNILYLHSHDTGRAIQPYGSPVSTPHLQKLAGEGVMFRDAHCVAPTCSPSRAGLLTGQSAHGAGMVGLAHRGGRLVHPERHLARVLSDHGFETVRAGMAHLGDTRDHGYTVETPHSGNQGEENVGFAKEFLLSRGKDCPFFLDVGFTETHRMGRGHNKAHHRPGDGDGDASFVSPPPILPDTARTRRDWRDFMFSVERLDGFYGEIFDALHEAGLDRDTLILVTTDHGLAFPDMKCKLTHHGTGVLQILRLPNGEGAGTVVDELVSHLDIYPTVCDLLDVDAPDWLEGRSLLPLIRGGVSRIREELFAEVTFHSAFEPKRSVRTKEWNYILNFGPPRCEVLPNCDSSISKDLWMEKGLARRPVPGEELYDLIFDPQERHNLLAGGCPEGQDSPMAEVKRAMRSKLETWMRETKDPLLNPDPAAMPLPQLVNPPPLTEPGSSGSEEWDSTDWETLRTPSAP